MNNDKIKKEEASDGYIYLQQCNCGKKQYIGNTKKQRFINRIQQHKRAVKNKDMFHSGLAKHVVETRHTIDD